MFYNSNVYQTLPFNPFNLVNQLNVVYLDYSSIPASAELGPAQPQLVIYFVGSWFSIAGYLLILPIESPLDDLYPK